MLFKYTPAQVARLRAGIGPDGRWTGQYSPKGYGLIEIRGRKVKTHRMAWELSTGHEVPFGWMVLHSCDDPPCSDARHLFLGTAKMNVADAIRKGRHDTRGEKNHGAKLTVVQVLEIRSRYAAGGCSYRTLAQEYGVSRRAIQRVVLRLKWRSV